MDVEEKRERKMILRNWLYLGLLLVLLLGIVIILVLLVGLLGGALLVARGLHGGLLWGKKGRERKEGEKYN